MSKFEGKYVKFNFICPEFGKFVKYPSGNAMWIIEYRSGTQETHLNIVTLELPDMGGDQRHVTVSTPSQKKSKRESQWTQYLILWNMGLPSDSVIARQEVQTEDCVSGKVQ